MDFTSWCFAKCLEGFGINGVSGGGWKTVVIIMEVLVCGLDRVKKVLKYVFKVHRSQIFFWWNIQLLTAKTKLAFLECKRQCWTKHFAFTSAAAPWGVPEKDSSTAHTQPAQPCLRNNVCGQHRALIFTIIIFNVKDFRFFAGCTPCYWLPWLVYVISLTLRVFKAVHLMKGWRSGRQDRIGHEKWSLMDLVGSVFYTNYLLVFVALGELQWFHIRFFKCNFYFWLHWIFTIVRGFSLLAESWGCSLVEVHRLLVAVGFSCGVQTLEHRL